LKVLEIHLLEIFVSLGTSNVWKKGLGKVLLGKWGLEF
jgi:hypothetical protein